MTGFLGLSLPIQLKSVSKVCHVWLTKMTKRKTFPDFSPSNCCVVQIKVLGEVGICSLRWGVSREMLAAVGVFSLNVLQLPLVSLSYYVFR